MTSVTTFGQSLPETTEDQGMWVAIRNRTTAIQFDRYAAFIKAVFCDDWDPESPPTTCNRVVGAAKGRDELENIGYGTKAYDTLKAATELFLLLNTGVYIHEGKSDGQQTTPACDTGPNAKACRNAANLGSEDDPLLSEVDGYESSEKSRLPNRPAEGSNEKTLTIEALKELVTNYLDGSSAILPYLSRIAATLDYDPNSQSAALCTGLLSHRVKCPLMIELIWNYWHEAGGQVQTMKAITRRFQNRRTCDERDPLADLDIDPLRPMGNVLWGHIQDEYNQLSVARRVYEYDHHYGVSLKGKAIPRMCTADSRSKFLAGFHNLLQLALIYYKAAENAYKIPDGFRLLNGLKEVHLLLAEGAGNQFGDLPWKSRVEMLMEQWILAREEMREFLRGRIMVPYPAEFMGRIDVMRRLQGWGDTSFRHFYELAIFGERLLLSVRYGDWSVETSEHTAKNWANYWREEVQGYVHAYRVVTGVDISDTSAEPTATRRLAMPPQDLITA